MHSCIGLVRIPETNGEPKFSGTITEIPVTDSRVASAAANFHRNGSLWYNV